ncbi:uncharacterized protein B0T15DRAFT_113688 [Chaetomium strumarium]|uniref:Uncharacterized protein n=1 Tax=Chaetomium strumarium TaxID=1170767 RepID=A0AAJ0GYV5_9PEZI|nr:hypothetical protein B0T15DRAFT_113688 [Chaetomium strumarium]
MLSLSAYCFPWLSSAEDEQTEPPPPADWRSSRQGPKHRQQRRQQHNLERPLYHRSSKSGRTSTSKAQPYYLLQDEPLSSDQTSPTASSSLFNNVGTSESYSPLLAVSGDLDSDSDLSPPSVRDKGAALRSRRRRRWVRRAMAQPSQSAAATEGLRRRRTRTALGNRVEVDDTIHEDSLSG